MDFSYYDLNNRSAGEIVQVTLSGSAANVFLVDSSNFQSYRAGRRYGFYGGHAKRSPVRLQVPRTGRWYVVIDFGGYAGSVRHSVQVLPGALPRLREAPLSSVPSLVQGQPNQIDAFEADNREYDVFISRASEDKVDVVRPLANALQNGGLRVWYDEFELKIGDSLRRKIDRGLSNSRFGVVVLSRYFFSKGWPNYELDGLVTRSVSGDQVLLPIWHNISKQEVVQYSPSLADKLARNTSMHTVEEIAAEIISVIRGE
jgi:Domain of unknown function (DUF1883)/TIR domain